jgi:hypothetical protein
MTRLKTWIKKWKCIFLHEKEIRELDLDKESGCFMWGFERFEGCTKCDIWRRM